MLKLNLHAVILASMAVLTASCSWFRDKPPEYMESRDGEPIEVPEDLDAPRYRSPVAITHPDLRMPSGDELNPGPPRVAATGGQGEANAWMAWSAEGVYLMVKDTPGSVARRLGFAIERAGMELLDKQPDGHHRFEYFHTIYDDRSLWQKLTFWNNDGGPDYSGIYRIRVEADGEDTRVYLQFDSGDSATTAASEHVLGIFMERLG